MRPNIPSAAFGLCLALVVIGNCPTASAVKQKPGKEADKGQQPLSVRIDTALGKSNAWGALGLNKRQAAELNNIGYTGKDMRGRKTTREQYLNALGNGYRYTVRQVKFDNGDYSESFAISALPVGQKAAPAPRSFMISTALGRSRDWGALGLTKRQIEELNTIGYTGKDSAGKRRTREQYLNSLDNGFVYTIQQTKFDNGDYTEAFAVSAQKR